MIDKIESTINTLKTMYPKKCKMIDGRFSGGYDDYESEKGQAITLAIHSLNAWKEVLTELETLAMQHLEYGESESYADVSVCIDYIKIHLQKLEQIEEE